MFTFELPVKRATNGFIEIRLIDQSELDHLYRDRAYNRDLICFDVAGVALYITNYFTMGDLFDIVSTAEKWYTYDHAIPQNTFDAMGETGEDRRGVWCYRMPQDYSGSFVSRESALSTLKDLLLAQIVTGKATYTNYIAEFEARQVEYKARAVVQSVEKWIQATS